MPETPPVILPLAVVPNPWFRMRYASAIPRLRPSLKSLALALALALGALPLLPLRAATDPASLSAEQLQTAWEQAAAFEAMGDYEHAIQTLAPVKALYPSDYYIHLRLAWLTYCNGNFVESLRDYQAAVKAMPDALEAKLGWMLPLLALKRYDQVEIIARQVLAVDPQNYLATLRLSIALRGLGKPDAAAASIERLLGYYPGDAALFLELAHIRAAQARYDDAIALCYAVLRLQSTNAEARSLLVWCSTPRAN